MLQMQPHKERPQNEKTCRMLGRINEPRYSWTKSEKRIPLYHAQKHLLPKLLGADFRADESEAEKHAPLRLGKALAYGNGGLRLPR